MKLLFIYGPPAVGKLTVAKELTTLTGYKLFHNHLTVDVVTTIFEAGSDAYFRLLRKIRFVVLEEAARANLPGIILTFVYSPSRLVAVEQYVELVESTGSEICFVRLYCDRTLLDQRVVTQDRMQHGKINSVEKLKEKLCELEQPFASIAERESLSLDVGLLTPLEAAQAIRKHYQLP